MAMTSMVDYSTISKYADFYASLLKVLTSQIMTMEQDFFEVSTEQLPNAGARYSFIELNHTL